eukprot:1149555-Pelagomonas_calceolata.AAC.3
MLIMSGEHHENSRAELAARFQLPVYTISATDFQKLAGIRLQDGPPQHVCIAFTFATCDQPAGFAAPDEHFCTIIDCVCCTFRRYCKLWAVTAAHCKESTHFVLSLQHTGILSLHRCVVTPAHQCCDGVVHAHTCVSTRFAGFGLRSMEDLVHGGLVTEFQGVGGHQWHGDPCAAADGAHPNAGPQESQHQEAGAIKVGRPLYVCVSVHAHLYVGVLECKARTQKCIYVLSVPQDHARRQWSTV